MTDLTEQEVCIGSLEQRKVYLKWSDVKDICTYAVSAAYEQTKSENAQLKELLKECRDYIQIMVDGANSQYLEWHEDTAYNDGKGLLTKIDNTIGEKK